MIINRMLKPCLHPVYVAIKQQLRKFNKYWEKVKHGRVLSENDGNLLIADMIRQKQPAAFGKIGNIELKAVRIGLQENPQINAASMQHILQELYVNAGVFPPSDAMLRYFADEFSTALLCMSVLGVYFNPGEADLANQFGQKAIRAFPRSYEPYYHLKPWSAELKGKSVLVVSPFVDTITKQYAKRELIWSQLPDVLPEFNLHTIKVPLSDAIIKSPYESWKACLDDLKRQMDSVDFDVALIGAGAYSLPLCTHAKSLGRIGIHMGGATQILFGVIGNRWTDHPIISGFFNEHWCRPSADESPSANVLVEGGCYW